MSSAASRILSASGERVTVTFEIGQDYDPVTGDIVAGGSEQSVSSYGYPANYNSQEIDGKDILSTDTKLLLPPTSRAPIVGCFVQVSGSRMRVMRVQSVRKSGKVELYICQLRSS